MGQLRDRMEADLRLADYNSPSTQKIYPPHAKLFSKFHMRSPAEKGEEEITQHLLYMVDDGDLDDGFRRGVVLGG